MSDNPQIQTNTLADIKQNTFRQIHTNILTVCESQISNKIHSHKYTHRCTQICESQISSKNTRTQIHTNTLTDIKQNTLTQIYSQISKISNTLNFEVPTIMSEYLLRLCNFLQFENVFTVYKGRMAPPKRMNFRKSSKGGAGGHFQSKNLYCKIWTFK